MKTQTGSSKLADKSSEQPYGIDYTWADSKGRMHLGRTAGSGRDRAHAERRFFRQHRHVFAEDGSTVDEFILLLVIVASIVALVSVLSRTRQELRASNERIDHLQFEVKALTHTVGEINAELKAENVKLQTSTGGAQ